MSTKLTLVLWTLLVWTTRIGNIWGDDALSNGEKWGRTGLALSFTVLAGATAWALWQRAGWLRTATFALAGWTVVVWVVRAVGIATGDHSAAFVAVHLVLATISIALAYGAARWRSPASISSP
ncbi:MAG: hypothetical protein ACRDZU_16935 [Acidimicrobiales bacterium]